MATTPPQDDRPFLGSTSGLTRQRLRARRFTHLSRDLYLGMAAVPSFEQRCDAALLVLPDAVLSHTTAAALWRLPSASDLLVHVTRPPDGAVCRREGVVTHRARLHPDDRDSCGHRPTTSLARTWVDLAAASTLTGLVLAGDVVLRRTGRPLLEQAVRRAGRRKGVVLARAALPLLDGGSASPAESRARLLLHAAGFTGLRHAVVVRDAAGQWLCEADLGDEQAQVCVQYDGLVHVSGSVAQRRNDLARDELARWAGWEVVVLTAHDDDGSTVAKVAAAYDRSEQRRRGRAA